jgi:predicted alpha-1,6-mannanase (GH76 family)
MASRQTYLDYAHAAAKVLTTKWFPVDGPTKWVDASDFWRAPNAMTSLTDLMQLDGTRSYLATADNAKTVFAGNFSPPWSPSYYDDECWWGACFLRLGALTGDAGWIGIADQIFDDLRQGWDDVAGGGVWWKRDPKSYSGGNEKGSIENELYMDIAMTLYAAKPPSEQQPYLDAAKQTWHWMQRTLVQPNGLVWGSLDADGKINPKNAARPYNQGTVLGPLWAMYEAEGDASYLDAAEKIVAAALDTMTWPDGVLREVCEERGDCGQDHDPPLFKGIFVRYLGEFTRRLATMNDPARRKAAQQYATFLQHNADAVWANFPGGIYGMDWHTPQPEYQPKNDLLYDGPLQSSALDLFVAAALVSE